MLSVELGGKTLTTTSDKLLIHINGMPMMITGNAASVYVNGKRVNEQNSPVLPLLGLGIGALIMYTLIFTEYGAQFMTWVFG